MLHACAARFDVMRNLEFFWFFRSTKTLFRSKKFLNFDTLSFLFDKHYPIIE